VKITFTILQMLLMRYAFGNAEMSTNQWRASLGLRNKMVLSEEELASVGLRLLDNGGFEVQRDKFAALCETTVERDLDATDLPMALEVLSCVPHWPAALIEDATSLEEKLDGLVRVVQVVHAWERLSPEEREIAKREMELEG